MGDRGEMPIEAAPAAARQHSLEVPEKTAPLRPYGINYRVDPTVSFAEFRYWAKVEREEEREAERLYLERRGPMTLSKMVKSRFSKGVHHETKKMDERDATAAAATNPGPSTEEKGAAVDGDGKVLAASNPDEDKTAPSVAHGGSSTTSLDEEWKTAARAMRTAGWGSIFFLVTTDILGWSNTPFVFASVGYGTGVALYVVFGIAATLSGLMLWRMFTTLDSSRYPMLSYGDIFFRVFGPKTRHFINVMQSLQQFCTVMVLIFSKGRVISLLAGPQLCFIVCMIIIMAIGMVFGSIRSLQRLSWICNLSVWFNIASFISIMVAAAKYEPFFPPIFGSTILPKEKLPVKTFAGLVPDAYQQQAHGFAGIFNGVDNMVYAYSGAILFVAFMSEMRHPMDFWKGMICAQAFICVVYLFFGLFVYSYFGQYSASVIYQVINPAGLRTFNNVLNLLTGLIAVVLYFHVGMKTVYIEVFQEMFNFPPIASSRGRWMWYALGPLYWIIAFLIAAAVPNLNGIVGFVGGLFAVNFSYSLPGIAYLGWSVQSAAVLPGEGFNPETGENVVHDSGMKRLARGFMARWYIHVPCAIYALAGLATSGMGTWAAVEGLISVFGPGGTVATSYGCRSPVWG
ncbi:Transmembrane amino acid transporter family protein [Cordyceps fumosorosea ARSEF 2679]|uniref:Transmembrane amino acid transporter family protein n=1 Tax=Cordyceps fumosorosea (strain ARSEF 2679) TaxID=1081104 RepID=A0A167Q457_CORFA|nr:Transmembrane amino acid transporter family protein [Cordyceps fumosorosea ARSEF 2679]OAA57266.1 Transmembrane amino acid transporter family protein [Cordyceps fumosorosea ARSEF 2679]